MVGEPASVARIPIADRWAALGAVIAIGALILTVTGWPRDDIRSLATDLNTLGGVVQTLNSEVKTLQVDVRALDAKVESIDKRLAVVEGHVLDVPSVARAEEEA